MRNLMIWLAAIMFGFWFNSVTAFFAIGMTLYALNEMADDIIAAINKDK